MSRMIACFPDSLTCRPDVGRRSAISADMAYIRPTSAAYRDKSAIFADMADIRPTSAAYRDKSAIFADMADIRPTPAEDRDNSVRRSEHLQTSGRRRQHIGTNRPYLPICQTPGRRREKTGTHRPEDRHLSATYADMADIRPTSTESRHISDISTESCRSG